MSKPNFANPEWEPTDEELRELAHEAFAGVAGRFQLELERRRAETQAQRARTLRDFAPRLTAQPT